MDFVWQINKKKVCVYIFAGCVFVCVHVCVWVNYYVKGFISVSACRRFTQPLNMNMMALRVCVCVSVCVSSLYEATISLLPKPIQALFGEFKHSEQL